MVHVVPLFGSAGFSSTHRFGNGHGVAKQLVSGLAYEPSGAVHQQLML